MIAGFATAEGTQGQASRFEGTAAPTPNARFSLSAQRRTFTARWWA